MKLLKSNSRLGSLIILLGVVHTKVEVHRMDSEISGLVEHLSFSLCTIPSVCYVAATSNDGKKSKMKVSADWCVTIEHWELSSIRVIFVDYQTSKLKYNY